MVFGSVRFHHSSDKGGGKDLDDEFGDAGAQRLRDQALTVNVKSQILQVYGWQICIATSQMLRTGIIPAALEWMFKV